jgi:glycine/D-amino acid oxidase-like deaminating enzyme
MNIIDDDCRLTPYWWDHVPRPAIAPVQAPATADVVVVGSGYTGLHAALQTARGGRHTVVFDAEDAGWGCSTRNGGQISTSVKPTYEVLARRHGAQRAFDILKEGQGSLAFVNDFVAAEGIDCDLRPVGRFHAAHNAAQFESAGAAGRASGERASKSRQVVPRAEQRSGSAPLPTGAASTCAIARSIPPATTRLLDRATAAGAQVVRRTR